MTDARTQALPPHILLECSQPGIVMLPKPGPLPVSLVAAYLQKILGVNDDVATTATAALSPPPLLPPLIQAVAGKLEHVGVRSRR